MKNVIRKIVAMDVKNKNFSYLHAIEAINAVLKNNIVAIVIIFNIIPNAILQIHVSNV